MLIKRAYRTELDPNNVQKTNLMKHCGAARFAYNWGIQRKEEVYRMNQLPVPHIKTPTAIDLHKELVVLKQGGLSWMYEVSKCAPQEALRDLDVAYKNFFEKRAGHPRFKSRKNRIGSFRLTGSIKAHDDRIQLPRLGKIRLKEKGHLPTDTRVLSTTVSEQAGRWFVSIGVEEEIEAPEIDGEVVGIDLGISRLAVVSDGTFIENPRALKVHERKLKSLQKEVSRKKKGSHNRKKVVRKLARQHLKISSIRKDAMHKATTELAKSKSALVVESLNVNGMLKNHCLAKAISDSSFGEFLRRLKYKAEWYGATIIEADMFYPSTKRCSNCGAVKDEMPLSQRVYRCEFCGFEADRDLNAALNLKAVAVSSPETLNACMSGRKTSSSLMMERTAMNQEPNAIRGVLNG